MKDLKYAKVMYLSEPEIVNMDWTGKGTDIFKKTITIDNFPISESKIYDEFLEIVNSFDYSDYPLVFNHKHIIRKDERTDIKQLRHSFKESYKFIRKNGLVGYPNFVITNTELSKFVEEFINEDKKFFVEIPEIIIDDNLDYILLGRKNENGQSGIFVFYRGEGYKIDTIGFRPKNQYVKLEVELV